jgi:hypothetical protein
MPQLGLQLGAYSGTVRRIAYWADWTSACPPSILSELPRLGLHVESRVGLETEPG